MEHPLHGDLCGEMRQTRASRYCEAIFIDWLTRRVGQNCDCVTCNMELSLKSKDVGRHHYAAVLSNRSGAKMPVPDADEWKYEGVRPNVQTFDHMKGKASSIGRERAHAY